MRRSASSYTTYTSQIKNRYTSKSVSNLRPAASSWSQPFNNNNHNNNNKTRGSTQWYKPKPLQLPASQALESKFHSLMCQSLRNIKQHQICDQISSLNFFSFVLLNTQKTNE